MSSPNITKLFFNNVGTSIVCFMMAIILKIIVNKKNTNIKEKKYFKLLLNSNIICILLEMIIIVISILNVKIISKNIINIIYTLMILYSLFVSIEYMIIVLIEKIKTKNEIKLSNKKIALFFIITLVISLIISICFQIETNIFNYDIPLIKDKMLHYIKLLFLIIQVIFEIVVITKKIDIKYNPYIYYTAIYILLLTLDYTGYSTYWFISMITILNMIFYFTIENDDLIILNKYTEIKNKNNIIKNNKKKILMNTMHDIRTLIMEMNYEVEKLDVTSNTNESTKKANQLYELLEMICVISNFNESDIQIENEEYELINLYNKILKYNEIEKNDKKTNIEIEYNQNNVTKLIGDQNKILIIIKSLIANLYEIDKYNVVKLKIYTENIDQTKENIVFLLQGEKIDEIELSDAKSYEEVLLSEHINYKKIYKYISKEYLKVLGGEIKISNLENEQRCIITITQNKILEKESLNKEVSVQ